MYKAALKLMQDPGYTAVYILLTFSLCKPLALLYFLTSELKRKNDGKFIQQRDCTTLDKILANRKLMYGCFLPLLVEVICLCDFTIKLGYFVSSSASKNNAQMLNQ